MFRRSSIMFRSSIPPAILALGIAGLILTAFVFGALTARAENVTVIKKIEYKKHTEINFTGSSVEGKAHAPEVFYIFQSRWSQGPNIADAPTSMNYDRPITRKVLEGEL